MGGGESDVREEAGSVLMRRSCACRLRRRGCRMTRGIADGRRAVENVREAREEVEAPYSSWNAGAVW